MQGNSAPWDRGYHTPPDAKEVNEFTRGKKKKKKKKHATTSIPVIKVR
jgi:hypothetical protein